MPRFQINGNWIEANTYAEAQRGVLAADMAAAQRAFLAMRNPVKTDLASIMKPHADYDFVGHLPDKLGIGTKFKVSAILNVPYVTVAGIGGLEWKVISGAALPIIDTNAGTIEAVANDPAGVRLKLVGVGGDFRGRTIVNEISIPVVEPTSAFVIKRRGYSQPRADHFSPYMDLEYWLTPDDVSFVGIEWQEPGGEIATVTGMPGVTRYVNQGNPGIIRHGGTPNTWWEIRKAHGGRRNYIVQTDIVGHTFGTDCGRGTFTWTINWAYRVKNPLGASKVFKRDVIHRLTVTVNGQTGQAIIEKMGKSHTELYVPPAPPALPSHGIPFNQFLGLPPRLPPPVPRRPPIR